jgi:GLPGLI family protein
MMNTISFRHFLIVLYALVLPLHIEAQSIVVDSADVVVGYKYSCNTRNADGHPTIEEYEIALLVGKSIVAQQGLCELILDEDNDDEYIKILTESQHNIPKIYFGFPNNNSITIQESILMNDFEMVERRIDTQWDILQDTIELHGYTCNKATTTFNGRKWTVWFSEDIPIPYGPWLLGGLPGLILKAESDSIHKFELVSLSNTKCPIKYERNINSIKTSRNKYVKYRNKIINSPLYLTNPLSLVAKDIQQHKDIYQFGNGVDFIEINGHIFNPHPNMFIPLDLK